MAVLWTLVLPLFPFLTHGLPSWSWDTVQTYIHCANRTGEWNHDALHMLAQQSFVVFEKMHKLWDAPVNTSAEDKIMVSCKLVKEINPNTDCYIYTESDWARTWYATGHWFDANPSAELQCPSLGQFPNTTDIEHLNKGIPPINGTTTFTYHFNAYDFSVEQARNKWIERVTSVVKSGYVDGAFIDGNRGGWNSAITSACDKDKRAAWAQGLKQSHITLVQTLGPNRTTISNYATPEALKITSGGMMERGGSGLKDIQNLQKLGNQSCGIFNTPCLVDYHAQYADRSIGTFNNTLAAFLAGMGKYAYYGAGGGWGGDGPNACGSWLKDHAEYHKPLGKPDGPATLSPDGTTFIRSFSTGTKVWVNTTKNGGKCIWWSDGTTTGNMTRCPKS